MKKMNTQFSLYAVTTISFISLVYFTLMSYPYTLAEKTALLQQYLLTKFHIGGIVITFNPIGVAASLILLAIFPMFLVFGLAYIITKNSRYAMASLFFLMAHIGVESEASVLVSRETVLTLLPLVGSAIVFLEGASRLTHEQERYEAENKLNKTVENMEADPLLKLHLSRLPQIEYLRIFTNPYGRRAERLAKTLLVPSLKLLVFLSAVLLVLFSQNFFIPKESSTMEFLLFRYNLVLNFNYLVFNVLLLLLMLLLLFSLKKVATIVHNATLVGEYEKSTVIESTIEGFLKSTERMRTPILDFSFSNFERNMFFLFTFWALILAPALVVGGSDAIKEAAVQTIINQPGYTEAEMQYLETINKNLVDLNKNLGDALNIFLKNINDSLAFGEK